MSAEQHAAETSLLHGSADRSAARQFIERAADAGDFGELLSGTWPTFAERTVLLQVGEALAADSRPTVRRVVAQLLGELSPPNDPGIELLLQLAADADAGVRLEAVAALGGARRSLDTVLPRLIAATADTELSIRQAAIWSLQDLGSVASMAIPHLRSLAEDEGDPLRQFAMDALPWIDASDPRLIEFFVFSLDDANPAVRASSASALGISAPPAGPIPETLSSHLADQDFHVAFFCVWALGRYGQAAEGHAATVLHRLRTLEWVNRHPQATPDGPDLRSTLRRILAPIPKDTELDDFRMLLFSHVFHPGVADDMGWIERVVNHPWYRKMQRARFPHADSRADRVRIAGWMVEAKAVFAERLWNNPLLGLTPERYRELPGFVKNHCRKVASRIMKESGDSPGSLESDVPAKLAEPSDEIARLDEAALLQGIMVAELTAIENAVIHCLYRDGLTIAETAAEVRRTESQVRTCEEKALSKLRRRLKQLK